MFANALFLTVWRLVAAPEKGTLAMSPIFNLVEPSECKGLTDIVCLKEYFCRVEESYNVIFKAIIGQRLLTTKMVTERISAKGL